MLNLCSNGVRGSTLLLRPTTLVRPHSASIASDLSQGYLVNNPALSRGGASTPTTLTKVLVCRSSLEKKKNSRNSATDFLKDIGLDDSQVENIANSHPILLRCRVEKTLIPKIKVLRDFGFCGSELISVIASNPILLTNVSRDSLSAKLDLLKSILGSVENVLTAVKNEKWLLYVGLTSVLQPNLELLKSYRLCDERLQKLLVKNPKYLIRNPKEVQERLVRVEQVLGIPRESAMFLHGFKVMSSLSKRHLEFKFEMFKRYGWSESDVLVMAKRLPLCLLMSEAKLKTRVDFFINKLGYKIGDLIACLNLLTYSMERILRRYAVMQVLQERELINHSICTVMTSTESRFLDVYVLPFKDELPELYEAYTGKKLVDSSVQKASMASDLSEGCLVNNPALSSGAATIDFLKDIGLDDSQVEKIINLRPKLLRSDVEKTLIPKIRVLEDFGIRGSELISVIAANPSLLSHGSTKNLLANLHFLKSILGSVEDALNALKKGKWLSTANLTERLQPNCELLKSYGLSDERVQKLLLRYLNILCCHPKWVQESLVGVEQVLGIPRESGMFLHGFKVMISLSKKNLKLKFELFKRYGWSESDVLVMVKRLPYCLNISEAKLKTRVDFFVNKLGYEIGYLAAHPPLLLYSMEDRILPRHGVLQVLQERNLLRKIPSIYTYTKLSESRFLDAYVLPFKDKLPELYEAYAGFAGEQLARQLRIIEESELS
ncbi:hypothetical protein Dimus_023792 [Dionaea muscipula]